MPIVYKGHIGRVWYSKYLQDTFLLKTIILKIKNYGSTFSISSRDLLINSFSFKSVLSECLHAILIVTIFPQPINILYGSIVIIIEFHYGLWMLGYGLQGYPISEIISGHPAFYRSHSAKKSNKKVQKIRPEK